MNWLDSLNESMEYIESHLDGSISPARAAALTGMNAATYTRVFQIITGMPLNEYIRRRRLTLAANDLAFGKQKVADVAMKYGYDSPTAFNRAFRAQHGVPPSKAIGHGATLKAYPRMRFQLQIKGDAEMEYEIKNMPAFKVAGKRWPVFFENGQNFKMIPKLWNDLTAESAKAIVALSDREPRGLLGACGEMFEGGFLYYIAAATTKNAPEELYTLQIPEANWAVFKSTGPLPYSLQDVIKRFYSEWLPASGYGIDRNCPELEVYSDGDTNAEDYECWAWMPIVKK